MNENFMIKEAVLDTLSSPKRKIVENLMKLVQDIVESPDTKRVTQPSDVYALSTDLVKLNNEHFVVFFLNTKNRVIKRETLSIGSLNASIVHPREVFRSAITNSAAAIICIHNHPSGDPTPSPEDIEVTRRLHKVGEVLGIEMLDHIIVARDGWVSLKERGLF